jgi:multicomponent Na+:H+ antiporter subunit E
MSKHRFIKIVATTAALFALWLILSDKRDVVHLATGIAGAIFVALSLVRRNAGDSEQKSPRPLRFLAYLPWLIWQILLSNFHVAKLVLSKNPKIRPRFLRLRPTLKNPRALTLLGSSITLTPGTLTVDINSEELIVHALDDAVAADIEKQTIERKISHIFDEVVS